MFVKRIKQTFLSAVVLTSTVVGASALFVPSAQATTVDSGTGSAYGLELLLAGSQLIPPTPTATLGAAGQPASSTLISLPLLPLVEANVANAGTSSTNFGSASEVIASTAGVAGDLTLDGVNLLNALGVQAIDSQCASNKTGSVGSATFLYIGNTNPTSEAANSTIAVPPGLDAFVASIEANVQTGGTVPGSTNINVIGLQVTLLPGIAGPTGLAQVNLGESSCAATGPDIDFTELPPTISATGISPTFGPSAGGTTVTITGTNFDPSDTTTGVGFGGVAATQVTVVNSTTITAVDPAHAAGPVSVTVGDLAGVATAAQPFTYVAPPTIDTTDGISPTSGPITGGTKVTITGTNFSPADTTTGVGFGGVAATQVTVVNSTTITAIDPAHAAGPVSVTVGDSAGVATAAQQFTYVSDVVNVSSIAPAYGPVAGGTKVTITGTGFSAGSTVTFGGAAAAIVGTPTTTSIVVTSPAAPGGTPGTVDVIVTTPAPNGGTSPAVQQDEFTYVGVPTIATNGVQPNSGPTGGGTPVTITGSNFAPGDPTSVVFDTSQATAVVVVNSTTITAVTPAHALGVVSVTVGDDGGVATLADAFTYVAGPSIVGISPTSGPPGGGETVTIGGTNLCGATAVDFGSTSATITNISTDCTTVTVTEPPGTGTVAVSVTTPVGVAVSPIDFTYIAPGYWEAAGDGGVFSFGGAQFYGSVPQYVSHLNSPIVTMADTPDHGGYWLFAADGGVFAFGDAKFFGSVPGVLGPEGRTLNGPIVAAEASPDGLGYRMFAADGGVFDFGDAKFTGSLPGEDITPPSPITAAASAPIGQGYWLSSANGAIYTFGSAANVGSAAGAFLGRVVALGATPTGQGLYLFLAGGAVGHLGDALANLGGGGAASPIVFGEDTSTGKGYWEFSANGTVSSFGDAPNLGGTASIPLNAPITSGIAFGAISPGS